MSLNPILPVAPEKYLANFENLRNQQIEDYLRDHFTIEQVRQIIDRVLAWTAGNFSVATYASIVDSAISIPTIDATWRPFDNYTSDNVVPREITTDLVAGTLAFNHEGVYQMAFSANLSHNESNAGRTISLRVFNVTAAAPVGDPIDIAIARNQPGTNIVQVLLFEIGAALVGQAVRWEISSATDTLLTVAGTARYSAFMVSEWKEAIIDPFSQAALQASLVLPNVFKLIRTFDAGPLTAPFTVLDSRINENSFVLLHVVPSDDQVTLGEVRNGEIDIEFPPQVMAVVEVRLLVVK